MANKYPGRIGTISIGDGAVPEVFTAVANVGDISGVGFSSDTIDVTTRENSAIEEFVGGMARQNEITISIVWDPQDTTHDENNGLMGLAISRAVTNFMLDFAPGGVSIFTMVFAAVVTNFDGGFPLNDRLGAEVTLKPSGLGTINGV